MARVRSRNRGPDLPHRTTVVLSPTLPPGLGEFDPRQALYLVPAGFLTQDDGQQAVAAGVARPLAGGPTAFSGCVVLLRDGDRVLRTYAQIADLVAWSVGEGDLIEQYVSEFLSRLTARRAPFGGISLDRPIVMGVVNVTPDSFSDGGRYFGAAEAIAHGVSLLEAGADIIDVGGESTRPGATPVAPEEEIARIEPVIRSLAERGARVSVDTRHAAVMEAAAAAGASIINDVTGLEGDPGSLRVASALGLSVVVMHMQGDPRSMQTAPSYRFAPLDIYDYLEERVSACLAAGIQLGNICVDPGIGFGKTVAHNVQVLSLIGVLHGIGSAVLLGASRKSFIAGLSDGATADKRLSGSVSAALVGAAQGVQIFRVHDVSDTRQALATWFAAR